MKKKIALAAGGLFHYSPVSSLFPRGPAAAVYLSWAPERVNRRASTSQTGVAKERMNKNDRAVRP